MALTTYVYISLALLSLATKNTQALTLNQKRVELHGWTEVGCYTDISSGRTLSAASYADPAMTVESCLDFCTAAGTHYAGVENGNECWCDFATQNPGVAADATECNVPCVGDPLETCGAGGRMNLYNDGTPDPVVVQTVDTWAYKGCFLDGAGSRTLLERIDGPGPLTPAQCTATCKANGYQFTGLEFSLECWCGHEVANPVLEDDSDCRMACLGDHTAFCGGANRLTLYEDIPIEE